MTAAPAYLNLDGISESRDPEFANLKMFGTYNLESFDEYYNAVYKHAKYPNRYSMRRGSLRDGIVGWWVSI